MRFVCADLSRASLEAVTIEHWNILCFMLYLPIQAVGLCASLQAQLPTYPIHYLTAILDCIPTHSLDGTLQYCLRESIELEIAKRLGPAAVIFSARASAAYQSAMLSSAKSCADHAVLLEGNILRL